MQGDAGKARTEKAWRFYHEVVVPWDEDSCLFWPFGKSSGYGTVYKDGRQLYVHRLVCELVNGPCPEGKIDAAHSCGNGQRGCVNPRHMRWATRAENMRDKVVHGTAQRGEKHGKAKLTEDDVKRIRGPWAKIHADRIAESLGVSPSTVRMARLGMTWRHL